MTSPGGRLQGAKSRDSVDSEPVNRTVSTRRKRRHVRRHCDSVDSQFTEPEDDDDEIDEEMRFFEACVECDDDALYDLLHDGLTYDDVNKQDKSGRTGLSHACGNGFMPILQLLDSVEEIDPNMPDNDGNTPLIFAAQAGHDDIVNFLLRRFHRLKVDQCNKLGFTALMKAAIQGRSRCAKLLLFAGASPNRRDYGRRLCAEEWARFCGRHSCADAIQKYIRSTKYFFAKTFLLAKDKWKSEPDLMQLQEPPAGSNVAAAGTGSPTVTSSSGVGGSGGSNVTMSSSSTATTTQHKSGRRDSGTWIQRHLSLTGDDSNNDNNNNSDGTKKGNWFQRHLSLKRKKNQNQGTTDPGQDEADQQQQQSSAGTSPTKSSSTATWRQRSGSPLKRSGSVASSSRRRRSSQAGGEDEDGSQDRSDYSNDSDNDDRSCSRRWSLTDADEGVKESQAGGAGSRLTGRRSSCVPVCTSTLPLPMICVTLDSSSSPSSTPPPMTSTTATDQQDSPVSEEKATTTGSGDDVETSDV